jgi:hypothetical protein
MQYHCFHETVTKTKFMGKSVDLLIRAYDLPEGTDPADSFELNEDIQNVRSGKYGWCCIKVEATLLYEAQVIGTGTDYLGCVTYADMADLKGTMLSHDMPETALARAIKEGTDKFVLFSKFKTA